MDGDSRTRQLPECPEPCFLFRIIEGMFKNLKFDQKTKRKICSREMYIKFVNLTISKLVEVKQLRIKQFYSFNFLFLMKRQITENTAQRLQGGCNPLNYSTGSARVFYMFSIKEKIVLFDEHIFSRDTVII